MKCPPILSTAILCDDPLMAAIASARLGRRGHYLPVMDGPRMTREDAPSEAISRMNALVAVQPRAVITCGLTPDAVELLRPQIHPKLLQICSGVEDFDALYPPVGQANQPPFEWGTDAVGVGLLKALYAGRDIKFVANKPTERFHPTQSTHLVVVEEGFPLSEVIGANYAFALGAGLALIPAIPEEIADEIIEDFYSAQNQKYESETDVLKRLRDQLRAFCRDVPMPRNGSVTFISRDLPLGYGFPEHPSSHLFSYPDLGRTTLIGMASAQPIARGVNVAVVLDPEKAPAPEIERAAISLANRNILVRGYRGASANVRDVTEMVEGFPYDLLIVATHCGDIPGYRWTYEFSDSEGHDRTLVTDIAIGVATSDDPDMLRVSQYLKFHSLDGIDWNDREAKAEHYIGTAIIDFMTKLKGKPELEPTKKENIDRVLGSAALQMHDSVYLPFARSLAGSQNPIILNNACTSWRELASRFSLAGARSYIGTIIPVSGIEAEEVTKSILGKHFDKPLAHAIWSAQRNIYGDAGRSPYVVTGVYPQRLRTSRIDTHAMIEGKLQRELSRWQKEAQNCPKGEKPQVKKSIEERVRYYDTELKMFRHFLKKRAAGNYGVEVK